VPPLRFRTERGDRGDPSFSTLHVEGFGATFGLDGPRSQRFGPAVTKDGLNKKNVSILSPGPLWSQMKTGFTVEQDS